MDDPQGEPLVAAGDESGPLDRFKEAGLSPAQCTAAEKLLTELDA